LATDDPIGRLAGGPIFVFGMARSGTTWVYDLLTGHPEVGGVLESWMLSDHAGLAVLFQRLHWPEGRRSGLGRIMTREELVADVRSLAGGWLTRNLEPGQRFVVEKSPPHVLTLGVIAEVFPEARFVHVLRDGRDVAVSVNAATRSWAPQWKQSFGNSVAQIARTWRKAVLTAAQAARSLGDRYLEVRYEQLRREPVAGARELYGFCGIPCDEEQLARIVADAALERRPRGEGEFRRFGRVGEWRTRLSLADRAIFDLAAGDALIATGYEQRRWWWLSPDPPSGRR
jgi:hypothetical protein